MTRLEKTSHTRRRRHSGRIPQLTASHPEAALTKTAATFHRKFQVTSLPEIKLQYLS